MTYLGNKRALLGPIDAAVRRVRARLGGRRIRALDAFSGSGVVSRLLKGHSTLLVSNDLEPYAGVLGRCFLANRSDVDLAALDGLVRELGALGRREVAAPGFIEEMYAPRDDEAIAPGERVFYSRANARRLDVFRRAIEDGPPWAKDLLLGPLLARASVHANTAGVFKGFYKDRRTGVGQFGGSGRDALSRILGTIELEAPILSRHEVEHVVLEEDANALAARLRGFDLAYLDPPYNQHPYGSNYFMLNLLVRYERPTSVSRVSGIPADWQRSGYNGRRTARPLFERLLADLDAPFVLVSFNDEGFLGVDDVRRLLAAHGTVEALGIRHPAFRGSRSFEGRRLHVTEHLFLLERA